jgi:hypothetical protein
MPDIEYRPDESEPGRHQYVVLRDGQRVGVTYLVRGYDRLGRRHGGFWKYEGHDGTEHRGNSRDQSTDHLRA